MLKNYRFLPAHLNETAKSELVHFLSDPPVYLSPVG